MFTCRWFQEEHKFDDAEVRKGSNHHLALPGKKGICFRFQAEGKQGSWKENLPKVTALKPYWNYSWGINCIDAQPSHIEYIPMVWGGKWTPDSLRAELEKAMQAGNIKRIFAFNEPDRSDQSNMEVSKAIDLWPVLQEFGLPIASPSCSAPSGEWMAEFMKHAQNRSYQVDYVGVHWYGEPSVKSFQATMREHHKNHKKPLIITEFAPADWKAKNPQENRHTRATVLAFMKEAIPWIEEQDWIIGYSWFPFPADSKMGTCSALFKKDGSMTVLGQFYASVSKENPHGDQSIEAWA